MNYEKLNNSQGINEEGGKMTRRDFLHRASEVGAGAAAMAAGFKPETAEASSVEEFARHLEKVIAPEQQKTEILEEYEKVGAMKRKMIEMSLACPAGGVPTIVEYDGPMSFICECK